MACCGCGSAKAVVPETPATPCKIDAIDGNEAAAYIAYGMSEFLVIFPISPSSAMSEKADSWCASGKLNCYGTRPIVYQMESEAGVAGALHGCGATGGLGATFTASQGLLLMIPNLYKMAGELVPAVVHVSSRQVGTAGTSIYCDHSDAMSVRATGLAMVCSANAQESMDFAAAVHLASMEASLPTLHWFDGYTTSNSLQSCERIPYSTLAQLINKEKIAAFRKTGLDPASPHQRGCIVGRQEWMQIAESSNRNYIDYADALENALARLQTFTGRSHGLYEWAGAPDAELAIVILGSASYTVEEVVDWLVAAGQKVGVLRVHLYRPWCERRFMEALPKTVRRVAVLDRCREGGAVGEPLLLDVALTVMNADRASTVTVVGGRYGIGDKTFDQSHVAAVFANLASESPRRRFTVGVVDDVTNLALPLAPMPRPPPSFQRPQQASIWGIGSDGSVGACHMALKLLASGAGLNVQGQFFYTAHKSGGVTVSHLRFGKVAVKGMCAVTEADYIGVHCAAYVGRYDVLHNAVPGAYVVVNSAWQTADDVPVAWRKELSQKKLRLYALDATKKFKRAATLALTAVFFKLSSGDAISPEAAVELLKEEARVTFRSKGDAVIAANLKAIDDAFSSLVAIDVPAEWAVDAPVLPLGHGVFETPRTEFDRVIKIPLQSLSGDDTPVSSYRALTPGGRVPLTTARLEKRGVAQSVPVWDQTKCTQCNLCSTACPHAVIRPFLLKDEEVKKAGLTDDNTKQAVGAGGAAGLRFRIQVSVLDCTGCGVCTAVCPTKCLELKPLEEVRDVEAPRWKYLFEEVGNRADVYPKDNLRGLQFQQPLFEFSGACAGCGETPYIKMLTQLVGDRAVFACASGCNAAYAFAYASNPYCTTPEGRGPAVAHSLFEDTAEFSYGAAQALFFRRNQLLAKVQALLDSGSELGDLGVTLKKWLEVRDDAVACEAIRKQIPALLEAAPKIPQIQEVSDFVQFFPKTTIWVIGGDGWASDIDYGGIDHVLSLGLPIKILILDTEVYSNTGGQQSKATPTSAVHKFAAGGKRAPKKDLAMTFLATHERVAYVASVCVHSNAAQAMRAMSEAEAYPGPAVVVCYCPCIEHGIEGSSPSSWVTQARRAVDSGYWPIWRWDPRKDKLALDGPAVGKPKIPLVEFVSHENRFNRLLREHPEAAVELVPSLEASVKARLEKLLRYSGIATPSVSLPAVEKKETTTVAGGTITTADPASVAGSDLVSNHLKC